MTWLVNDCTRSWEDGQLVDKELEATDRWAIHSAEHVTLTVGEDITIAIRQHVSVLGCFRRL
jgi:hypothetical protein